MKYIFEIFSLLFIVLSAFLFQSCEKKEVPVVTTIEVTDITGSGAACGGTVIKEGTSSVYTRGICWSTDRNPSTDNDITNNGAGLGTYTSNITGLKGSFSYHVRAYATNSTGTGYGEEISFRTPPRDIIFNQSITYGSISDYDGNVYRTVQIGQQTWMAENLKATHYQDGSVIPNVNDLGTWISLTSGAYCFYENDTINKDVFGVLYNWYAVADQRKICPAGWHVSSDDEWTVLDDYLGGYHSAGMKMKEVSMSHWTSPNLGASNESGFTALPAGARRWYFQSDFSDLGTYGVFWTSTEYSSDNIKAWYRYLFANSINISGSFYLKVTGFSVRCVKD
jgi:uncharacterized protein (TIGR02145 family)